ncbi:MAG: Fe-S-containing hydro-lyase [candidate division NC10 bacterium]|nr:Fe-S-containing hydro-lyase [candidate division NC10 bacterium]
MVEEKRITTPLSDEIVKDLRAGDKVLISGVLYTGRDAAHKRLFDLLQAGEKPPVDLRGHVIYYVGPTPPRPGQVIGSAGPTTSGRMDRYCPALIAQGLRGMIGKGGRSKDVIEAMKTHKAVYFGAIGGAGALLAKKIKKSEVVAYEDLGAEAIHRLEVEDFPVVVVNDIYGNDLYQEGARRYSR